MLAAGLPKIGKGREEPSGSVEDPGTPGLLPAGNRDGCHQWYTYCVVTVAGWLDIALHGLA
jgi:hypothetical protein